jgi:hypothetical protein
LDSNWGKYRLFIYKTLRVHYQSLPVCCRIIVSIWTRFLSLIFTMPLFPIPPITHNWSFSCLSLKSIDLSFNNPYRSLGCYYWFSIDVASKESAETRTSFTKLFKIKKHIPSYGPLTLLINMSLLSDSRHEVDLENVHEWKIILRILLLSCFNMS